MHKNMYIMRHQWLFLINDCMIVYCSLFPHSQQLGRGCLEVVWWVLAAGMAAGPPCSVCSVCLWRGKCLNPLLLIRLRHQGHFPARTLGAPASFFASWAKSDAGGCCKRVRALLQSIGGCRRPKEQRWLAGTMVQGCVNRWASRSGQ